MVLGSDADVKNIPTGPYVEILGYAPVKFFLQFLGFFGPPWAFLLAKTIFGQL